MLPRRSSSPHLDVTMIFPQFPSGLQRQLADAGPGFQCCERLRPICKFADGGLAMGENAGCDERE